MRLADGYEISVYPIFQAPRGYEHKKLQTRPRRHSFRHVLQASGAEFFRMLQVEVRRGRRPVYQQPVHAQPFDWSFLPHLQQAHDYLQRRHSSVEILGKTSANARKDYEPDIVTLTKIYRSEAEDIKRARNRYRGETSFKRGPDPTPCGMQHHCLAAHLSHTADANAHRLFPNCELFG